MVFRLIVSPVSDICGSTFAAFLTLSSLPCLWTNTEAGLPSWRMAEYMVRPEGSVSSGSSKTTLRRALFSAPMANVEEKEEENHHVLSDIARTSRLTACQRSFVWTSPIQESDDNKHTGHAREGCVPSMIWAEPYKKYCTSICHLAW